MSSNEGNKYEVPTWRRLVVYGLIVAVVGLMISRLVSLQVLSPETWTNQAIDNYTNEISEPAARGIIYDRNGYILARNIASYNVVITPADLPDDDADIQRIYREVAELTGVPAGGPVTDETLENAKLFSACVPGPSIADMVALGDSLAPYKPVKISCNISEELARVIKDSALCALGQTAANPIRTTLKNFRYLYERLVRNDSDYSTQFDLAQAVAESCAAADREPKLVDQEARHGAGRGTL